MSEEKGYNGYEHLVNTIPSAQEQIIEFTRPENRRLIYGSMQSDYINDLVNNIIPIYTFKNPNPKNQKPDCPLIVQYKTRMREDMRKKIEEVIQQYESKVKNNT